MDLSVIQTLISTQDKAYQSALEIFMNQINGRLQAFQGMVTELTRSLEFTQGEVGDLQQQVKRLENEKKKNEALIEKLTGDLQASDKVISELEERCNYQEDYSRRNNVRITGLQELQGETWEQTTVQVSKLLEEKLQLPKPELERAHRVGPRRHDQPRQVIARFIRYSDREAAIRNAAKLRGTRIYINEDLCPASQEVRRAKLPLLKQAKSEGKIAYFNHTTLIIRERPGASSRDGVRANAVGVGIGISSGGTVPRRPVDVPVAEADPATADPPVNATTDAVDETVVPTHDGTDAGASTAGAGTGADGAGVASAAAPAPDSRVTRGKGKGPKKHS